MFVLQVKSGLSLYQYSIYSRLNVYTVLSLLANFSTMLMITPLVTGIFVLGVRVNFEPGLGLASSTYIEYFH